MLSKNLYLKKNGDLVGNILGKNVIFFLAIFTFYMAALDAATKFRANEISFFSFYLFLIQSYSVFCQKVAKVEHTICDCN